MIREQPLLFLGVSFLAGLAVLPACRGPILPPEPGGNLALWLDRRPAPHPARGGKTREERGKGKLRPRPSQEAGRGAGKARRGRSLPPLPEKEVLRRRREAENLLQDAWKKGDPKGLPAGLQVIYSARQSMAAGDLDGAAVDLQDRLAEDPGDFLALCELGRVRVLQGAFQEAAVLLEKALRRAPGDPESKIYLARALAGRGGKGDLARSEALLKSALPKALDPVRVYHFLFLVYLKAGKTARAVQVVSRGLEKIPGDLTLLGDQIQGLILLGKLEDALQVADRLSRPPRGPFPQALWFKAFILRRLGRFREAVSVLEKLAAGKGKEFRRFFARRMTRDDVKSLILQARREARAGRRIYYLPGEREEILRTDPDEIRRLQVVQSLEWALPRKPFKVLDLALSDRSATVRTAALQVLGKILLGAPGGWKRVVKALSDPEPRVRGMAARIVGRSHRPDAAEILFSALEKEKNGYVFRCICDALRDATGKDVLLMGGEENSPESRSRVVREWKEKLKK